MFTGARIALLTTPRTYAEKVLTTQRANLIAYWRLAEGAGTVADNAEGTDARDGTYSGVVLGQPGIGDGGSAPSFDGVNDFVNIYSTSLRDALNGQEGTYAAWLRVASAGIWTDATIDRFLTLYVDANNYISFFKHSVSNTIRCDYQAGAVLKSVSSTAMGGVVTWFHVAITWSKTADQYKVYLGGVQVGTTQTVLGTFAGVLPADNAKIGSAEGAAPGAVWNGFIAHAALWTTPLTAAHIAALATLA